MRSNGMGWPNSALRPTGVIALCEIINSPAQFTSASPHYVVPQLDWIQCRYLFVQTTPGSSQNTLPIVDELPQDPTYRVQGPNVSGRGAGGYLQIPRKALPASRATHSQTTGSATSPPPKRPHDSAEFDEETDEEDTEDLDALFSGDESTPPSSKRFQSRNKPDDSRDSSVDTLAARRLTTKRPLTPPKQSVDPSTTDFRPGALDMKSIPQLALPEWADANASRRLATDIKAMYKVQESTPLHVLGWYIDFDKIDNMFQWIVELHTFDPELPLAKDMKRCGVTSIVLELRFGKEYPFTPPFVRVIRPKFLPFMNGGGKSKFTHTSLVSARAFAMND